MSTINPYLNFPGNTEEAFTFYQSVFGGEFIGGISRFKDTPEANKLSKEEQEKVMHIALPVGNGQMLMATDALKSMGQSITMGNNMYISIHPESREEADRLFKGLSKGGEIEMDLQDTFWGGYFGSFTDKFGVKWMVHYQEN